jgi:hypothetical protein
MTGTVAALEFTPPVAAATSNLSINFFQQAYAARSLRLRPPFQRNLVWNLEQQSFLIDTVLRGLPVPEVYIQTIVSAEGEEETIVVDGQQRITACLKFLNGQLRLVDDDELDARWRGKTFAELDNGLKRRFRGFQLVVRGLPELNELTLREIFRRLNKTVEALEPQELRHAAYTGPFVQLVEKAAAQPVLGELGVFSAKDFQRRRNDELMAEICYALVAKAYPNKKDGLDELFLTYERQGMPAQQLHDLSRRLGRLLEQLTLVSGQLRRTRFRNKSDFYSLGIVLAKKAEHLPLGETDTRLLMIVLTNFGNRVNEIKREEAAGRSTDALVQDNLGVQAARYLRAVERAASDRLNRVRREEALQEILTPVLLASPETPLSETDASWLARPLAQDDADEIVVNEERHHTQQVLTEADSDALDGVAGEVDDT